MGLWVAGLKFINPLAIRLDTTGVICSLKGWIFQLGRIFPSNPNQTRTQRAIPRASPLPQTEFEWTRPNRVRPGLDQDWPSRLRTLESEHPNWLNRVSLSQLNPGAAVTQCSFEGHSELVSSPNQAVFEAIDSWRPILHVYNLHIQILASVIYQIQFSNSTQQ